MISFTVWTGTSNALGLENRTIEDHQMSASSQYYQLAAHEGRLHNTGVNFWASSTSDMTSPWLQVDFLQPVVITGIQTQGAGVIAQYPTHVQIQYGNDVYALQNILENGSPKVTQLYSCDFRKGGKIQNKTKTKQKQKQNKTKRNKNCSKLI